MLEMIDKVVERNLVETHTALPVEIVSYDHGTNLAVVQPVLKRKYKNESSPVKLPTIANVPVAFPRMGAGHLRFPVNVGDTGQLIVNERSIDGWQVSGGIIDPQDPRRNHLSDGVFYPGLNPNSKAMVSSAPSDSLELKLNGSHFEILGNGKFKITNGKEELFDLLVQLLEKVIEEMTEQGENDFTNTIFGPLQPVNFPAYNLKKVEYQELKTKLESLKG
jgi:hypothetical protein